MTQVKNRHIVESERVISDVIEIADIKKIGKLCETTMLGGPWRRIQDFRKHLRSKALQQ